MGSPKNITNKTFEEAAQASETTVEEAKRNTYELLKKYYGNEEGKQEEDK